jgi:type IV pilus assembly PilN-like protein
MQQINLYQDQFKPEKITLAANQVALLSLLFIILLFVFSIYSYQKVETHKAVVTEQQQHYDLSQQQLNKLQQQLSQQNERPLLEIELAKLEQKLQDKQTVLDYLSNHTFGNQDGFSGTLTSLSQQRIDNVWLTSFALLDGGQFISLQGNSTKSNLIPEYIDSLANADQFHGKEFSVFQLQHPDNISAFYNFKLNTQKDRAGIR